VEAAPRPRRLTQEERSAETRARLLDATIQSLVEAGYARTTTTRVCEIAGLSRGAQIHHFHTRAELVTAALEHLARKRLDEFSERTEALRAQEPSANGNGHDPLEVGLDLLWESFSGDLFIAALELWVAARTDPDLHERLLPLEREIGRQMSKGLDRGASPETRDLLRLSHHVMRGMVLQRILNPDDAGRRRQFDLFKQIASASVGRSRDNGERKAS
jgi:AcrR family transcriptional regulator